MSRTNIPANVVSRTGFTTPAATAADVANGNSTTNTSTLYIEVTNSDTAIHNVTFQPTALVDGQMAAAVSHAIPASQVLPIKFGPFSPTFYGGTLLYNGDNANIKFNAFTF